MTLKDVEKVQNWILSVYNDPLAKILLDNSHFTKKQIETFLIDLLADQFFDKKYKMNEKTKMRLSEKNISRGAFGRTLNQAKKNMMKSIFTILLLGYLRVLETPSLSPFLEAGNRMESLMEEFAFSNNKREKGLKNGTRGKNILFLKNNLKNLILDLIKPAKQVS